MNVSEGLQRAHFEALLARGERRGVDRQKGALMGVEIPTVADIAREKETRMRAQQQASAAQTVADCTRYTVHLGSRPLTDVSFCYEFAMKDAGMAAVNHHQRPCLKATTQLIGTSVLLSSISKDCCWVLSLWLTKENVVLSGGMTSAEASGDRPVLTGVLMH